MTGRLRITGGSLARRLLQVPAAADSGALRPTSDKVREALFSSLAQRFGVEGRRVVDACCGSGALGFEALSRGAASCTFIDVNKRTMRVVEENARELGLHDRCAFVVDDVARALARHGRAFDLVLCDPPYAMLLPKALRAAVVGALDDAGVLVLERAAAASRRQAKPPRGVAPASAAAGGDDDDTVFEGLSLVDERRYGDTRIIVAVKGGTEAEAGMASTRQSAAIYPGSFDPLTNGHVDIIERGLRMFDRLVLAVANNPQKQHFFSAEERIALVRQSVGDRPGLEIEAFDGLVVDFAKEKGVNVLLRGVRAVSDFEYEFQLAGMNRKLSGVETVFMATSEESFYVASRLVREVAGFGGDVSSMVPAPVLAALKARYEQKLQAKNPSR